MAVTVLIVDDDEAVRFFHRIIVTQSKLSDEPLSFVSCEEALDYLDRNCNGTDAYLILLDINMTYMNGWDLIEAINVKSYTSQVHIVIVSSSDDKADHEKAKEYNMVINFVEKPISVEECKWIINFSPIAENFKPGIN